MILTIIAAVLLIIAILFIIIGKKSFSGVEFISLLFFPLVAGFSIFVLVSSTSSVDEKEYLQLSFIAKHWDELNIKEQLDIAESINEWNANLNYNNNYWVRFNIEDRSKYIITIEEN